MVALGYCTRGFSRRRCSTNPYAERGLDKFALLSAELEAKKEILVAQLGTPPVSLLRFASGSGHSKWIPIIFCPTLSKAEMRALRRAATHLITEHEPAMGFEEAHRVRTSGVMMISKNNHSSSLIGHEKKDDLASYSGTSIHDPSHLAIAHAVDGRAYQIGALQYLLAASERFLCMAAFSLSIVADIVNNVILSQWHAKVVPSRISQSAKRPNHRKEKRVTADNPSAAMASSTHLSSSPVSMPREGIKGISPPHSLHVKAAKSAGFSTAPSTPRDSRQVRKPFFTSVSLPKTSHLQERNARTMLRGSTSTAGETISKKDRKERSEKLVGQALTGVGLALGLGGLVIGYIPAIMGVVFWWYVLSILRKDVGDKSVFKGHHHDKLSDEDNNRLPLKGNSIARSGKVKAGYLCVP